LQLVQAQDPAWQEPPDWQEQLFADVQNHGLVLMVMQDSPTGAAFRVGGVHDDSLGAVGLKSCISYIAYRTVERTNQGCKTDVKEQLLEKIRRNGTSFIVF